MRRLTRILWFVDGSPAAIWNLGTARKELAPSFSAPAETAKTSRPTIAVTRRNDFMSCAPRHSVNEKDETSGSALVGNGRLSTGSRAGWTPETPALKIAARGVYYWRTVNVHVGGIR